jgi:hypothetical protein
MRSITLLCVWIVVLAVLAGPLPALALTLGAAVFVGATVGLAALLERPGER